MGRGSYLLVTEIMFVIIAVMHLLRILYRWQVVVGHWTIPLSASWMALLVSGAMSLWSYRLIMVKERSGL